MISVRTLGAGPRVQRAVLITGMLLIAVNLRAALASVGPLVGEIRAGTGLSNTALGLVTTLPLLAFALISPVTPLVSRALGFGGALATALLLMGAGTAIRAAPSVALLYLGTMVLGVGIALGNVLMPALVKRDFAHRSGSMTGLYSGSMSLGAAVASATTVPIAVSLGWRGALGIWALPIAGAFLAWLPQLKRSPRAGPPARPPGTSLRALGGSPLAWRIALFMGLQSLTFYVLLTWLPDLLQTRGLSAAEAGLMLALTQATGIAGTAVVPFRAGRVASQQGIVRLLCLGQGLCLAGLLFTPPGPLLVFWVGLIGFVLGGAFGLSLLLLVLRAPDTETATALSGMAQSVGYFVAATGPALFGLLYDLSGDWVVPMLFLGAVLIAQLGAGEGAGRPGYVEPAAVG